MTNLEFSHGFSVLLDSYASKALHGDETSLADIEVDEYEKSLWLTKAEEALVLSLYNGRNQSGEAFEETEELRRYLSELVSEDEIDPMTETYPKGMDARSKFFRLPDGLWFITYESVIVSNGRCGETSMEVIPATQDEYHRLRKNPFRGPNDRRALRLDLNDSIIEIVSKYNVTKYCLRYLRKPEPIVLIDLPDGLSVNGVSKETECKLHEALHQRILETAVAMVLQSKVRGNSNNER